MIRTFQDVEIELRKINSQLDALRSQNLDLKGRRVINAGKAQDFSDYTTKQDVLDLLENPAEAQKIESGLLQVDFTVSTPTVGVDIAPRPVVYIPNNERGLPVLVGARLRTAATSNAFTLRWNHYSYFNDNTVDLFNGSLLTIPVNTNYATLTVFYPNRMVANQDYFTLDIVATGKLDEEDPEDTTGGSGLYTFLALLVD